MKRILLILITLSSFAFADGKPQGYTCGGSSNTKTTKRFTIVPNVNECFSSSGYTTPSTYGNFGDAPNGGYYYSYKFISTTGSPDNGKCNQLKSTTTFYDCYIPSSSDPQPDTPNGHCEELLEENGTAFNCNPNTGEKEQIPNSDGLINDPENGLIPNCNDGFEWGSTPNITIGGNGTEIDYNNYSCSPIETDTGDGGNTGDDNTGGSTGDTGDGSGSGSTGGDTGGDTSGGDSGSNGDTGGSGSTGGSSGGNTGGDTGGSSGGGVGGQTGTGSGSGSGSGDNSGDGDTSGEGSGNGDTGNTGDTGDTEPNENSSCNDSSLSLIEKTLCEINESNTDIKSNTNSVNGDSLGELLKELKENNQQDNTAINTNIKDIEKINNDIKGLNSQMNSKLLSIKGTMQSVDSNVAKSNTHLDNINKALTAPEGNGKAEIDTLDTIINDENNFSENIELTSAIESTVSNQFSSYSDTLKNKVLELFDSFFNIDTSSMAPLGVPYNFTLAGKQFDGTFLDESQMQTMHLDKLSNIIIFAFSLLAFFHAFRLLTSSNTTIKDK